VEFDGYIGIADATDNIHVAWHVLPHRAADVSPASTSVTLSGGAGTLSLSNAGTIGGRTDVFSLMGRAARFQEVPAIPGTTSRSST